MYVINEPTPVGVRSNAGMLVRDEHKLPITSSDGFWAHIVKTLFVTSDGLATLQSVLTVTLDPLTIGKPHPAMGEDTSDIEKVWTALDGASVAFVGNNCGGKRPEWPFTTFPTIRPRTPISTRTKTAKSDFSTLRPIVRIHQDYRKKDAIMEGPATSWRGHRQSAGGYEEFL